MFMFVCICRDENTQFSMRYEKKIEIYINQLRLNIVLFYYYGNRSLIAVKCELRNINSYQRLSFRQRKKCLKSNEK